MVRSCPVVFVAALTVFQAMCALLRSRGYVVCWSNSPGATVFDKADRTTHWRLARDEGVAIREHRLGLGRHVVRAHVGLGPTALACP